MHFHLALQTRPAGLMLCEIGVMVDGSGMIAAVAGFTKCSG